MLPFTLPDWKVRYDRDELIGGWELAKSKLNPPLKKTLSADILGRAPL